MTRESHEHELLSRARRAMEPSAADAARVLHHTRMAIAAGASVAGSVTATSLGARLMSKLAGPKLAVALCIAATGGLGFALGKRVGEHDAATRAQPAPQRGVSGPALEPPVMSALALEPPRVMNPHSKGPEAAALDTAAHKLDPSGSASTRRKSVRAAASAALDTKAADASVAEDALATSPALRAEIRALRQVERALRDRRAAQALSTLDALDGEVPAGKLMEERAAARAMARCESSGSSVRSAMQIVLEFSRAYPASMYFARVRKTCLRDDDASTTNQATDFDQR